MNSSRSQILNALRNSRTGIPFSECQDLPKIPVPEWGLEEKIEDCKETLFSVDAGLTQTMGAIAETGSLILKPDEQEPRLLSLVPPIHLAVLDSKRIYSTFSEAIRKEGWSRPMPTNVLLIQGLPKPQTSNKPWSTGFTDRSS